MKKLVALTLAAVMTVSVLTACGSKETAGSSTPAEGTEEIGRASCRERVLTSV